MFCLFLFIILTFLILFHVTNYFVINFNYNQLYKINFITFNIYTHTKQVKEKVDSGSSSTRDRLGRVEFLSRKGVGPFCFDFWENRVYKRLMLFTPSFSKYTLISPYL